MLYPLPELLDVLIAKNVDTSTIVSRILYQM
jgi:hypothetical protein